MWLLVAIVTSVVLGPRVFTGAPADVPEELLVATGVPGSSVLPIGPAPARSGPSPTVVLTASVEIPDEPPTTEAPATTEAATGPTSTTESPASTATTAKPVASTATTAKPVASTTTTTAPAATTVPPPPPPRVPEPDPAALSAAHADGVHEGMVSWYDLPGARAGVCAHRTIDKGTVVTVTKLSTGESITCTVNDRGPYSGDEKILDLHKDDFSRLAPLGQGVFAARLDW